MSDATESAVQAAAIDWSTVFSGLYVVPLEHIFERAENPREMFDSIEIAELCDLLRQTDNINIEAGKARRLVDADGHFVGFELLSGHRRRRALIDIGAPAMKLEIVEIFDGKATRLIALMSNLGKVDLSPMELCREYHRMLDAGDYPNAKALAAGTGQSGEERTIYNILTLKDCVPDVQDALDKKEISREHAIELARRKPSEQQLILPMCWEIETITIGSLPERSRRLISVKRLKSIIRSQFDSISEDKEDSRRDAEAQRTKEHEKATSVETSATKLLEQAEDGTADEEIDENESGTSDTEIPSKFDPKPTAKYDPKAGEYQHPVTQLQDFVALHFPGEEQGHEMWCELVMRLLLELKGLRVPKETQTPVLTKQEIKARKKTEARILKMTPDEMKYLLNSAVLKEFAGIESARPVWFKSGVSDDQLMDYILGGMQMSDKTVGDSVAGIYNAHFVFANSSISVLISTPSDAPGGAVPVCGEANDMLLKRLRLVYAIPIASEKPAKKKGKK